jgi:hypothetical protein
MGRDRRAGVLVNGVLVAFLFAAGSACADVTLSDGEFPASNWETVLFYLEGNAGSVDLAAQVMSGGNPGAFRLTGLTVKGTDEAHPYSAVYVFQRFTPFVYDPSVSGPIVSLDYAEDCLRLTATTGGQATGPALRQGGVVFVDGHTGTTAPAWTHFALVDRTAEDFAPYGNAGVHPDFTSSGGLIEFGFYRANSSYASGYSTLAGIDNWMIRLRQDGPVPVQPTSWGRVKALYR